MKKTIIICLFIAFWLSDVFAQSKNANHYCEVSIVDFSTDTGAKLGTFNTLVEREKKTQKSYKLPGTKLFVTVMVTYEAENPFSKDPSPTDVYLVLAVGKRKYPNLELKPGIATAEIPLKYFEIARVKMNYMGKSQLAIVSLECKKTKFD